MPTQATATDDDDDGEGELEPLSVEEVAEDVLARPAAEQEAFLLELVQRLGGAEALATRYNGHNVEEFMKP
jgi:hypothetical protein